MHEVEVMDLPKFDHAITLKEVVMQNFKIQKILTPVKFKMCIEQKKRKKKVY